jgi:putative toxin-antitoxin system antitoxin component (TIGR02293 family)
VKSRLPASQAKTILSDLAIPSGSASQALHLSVSTLNRKTKMQEALTQDESERVLGLAKLIGQVQSMVEESGDPTGFDAREWTARWLSEPLPALGGARPLDLMDTMEGQGLVADTLARIQSGAYA